MEFSSVVSLRMFTYVRMFTYEKFSIRSSRGEIRIQCCFSIAFNSVILLMWVELLSYGKIKENIQLVFVLLTKTCSSCIFSAFHCCRYRNWTKFYAQATLVSIEYRFSSYGKTIKNIDRKMSLSCKTESSVSCTNRIQIVDFFYCFLSYLFLWVCLDTKIRITLR